jgi:hypothetical protein
VKNAESEMDQAKARMDLTIYGQDRLSFATRGVHQVVDGRSAADSDDKIEAQRSII